MKHPILRVVSSLVLGIAVAALAVSPAEASRTLVLDDVLRLHMAGVSEDIIVSEILVTESVFELSVDDILRLKDAGLSDELIQFMVETALPPEEGLPEDVEPLDQAPSGSSEDESSWDDDGSSGESYGRLWYNEIEEPEPTYFVTLRYSYPGWWYDFYWYDYWYWDHHYYPYSVSYSWHCGSWYPAWWSYRHVYLPPYYGYGSYWYARSGYGWNYNYCSNYYPSGGYYDYDATHHPLSRTKYKVGGGTSSRQLYADVGLKVRDPGRHLSKNLDRGVEPRQKRKVLVASRDKNPPGAGSDRIRRHLRADTPVRRDLVRPTKPSRKLTRTEGVRTSERRPVRRPAVGNPPRRKVTRSAPEGVRPTRRSPSSEKPGVRRSTRVRPPESDRRAPPKRNDRRVAPPKKTTERQVKPARKPTQVKPAPARKSEPRVQSAPSRPAPKAAPPKATPRKATPRKAAPPAKRRGGSSRPCDQRWTANDAARRIS